MNNNKKTYIIFSIIAISVCIVAIKIAIDFLEIKSLISQIESSSSNVVLTHNLKLLFFQAAFYDAMLFLILLFTLWFLFGKIKYLTQKLSYELDTKTKNLQKNIAFFESYKQAMDQSLMVSKSNLKGIITDVNENFCAVSGYSKEEVLGKPHSILRHPDMPKELFRELWSTIGSKKTWKGILQNRKKDGSSYWVDVVITPILDEKGEINEYIAVRHEITELLMKKAESERIANFDILTGYPNRNNLSMQLKTNEKFFLAILNIDNFSDINDFYGHEFGDKVIQNIANYLASEIIFSPHFRLFHLRGDEYVILGSCCLKEEFMDVIRKIINKIPLEEFICFNEVVHVNITAGISFEGNHLLLSTADMALKVAKESNKTMAVYSQEKSLNTKYENNIKLATTIREALAKHKIIPYFQPIVNNHTKQPSKYESLVRLIDGERILTPYHFLEVSKKTKQYHTITKVMIEKTFEYAKNKPYEFSINLTTSDILSSDIQTYIIIMLELFKNGEQIVFEIVESESIDNYDEVIHFIENVKTYGCKIAIDDFGTGYSNFEYLLKLKADYIKIDGSLIKNLLIDKDSEAIVSTIVSFAQKIGMKTVAEFVESEALFDKVCELQIDFSQGYYFGKPQETII